MNLARRDITHNLPRFAMTCVGISLLLGIVITMMGIYRGALDDALRLVRGANPDLWVVEAGTQGPFAEASRIPGDTREMVARVYGVARAGAVTYQAVEAHLSGRPLRIFLVGYELERPGGPPALVAGRGILRSHYEMVADRSSGLRVGQQVALGTRDRMFTVVGLTQAQVTSAGDPLAYVTLADAQALQFELAPPVERRETVRRGPGTGTDIVNAVIADLAPFVRIDDVAAAMGRWKHLSALTRDAQERLVSQFVIEKQRKPLAMFMVLLVIVSAVIIALIIYTLTMDKLRAIATLKLIGAPDHTIVGLIVQQALAMGTVGFVIGLLLVMATHESFPRRVVLLPGDVVVLFAIVLAVCLLASGLGVRVALKVEPARALAG